MKNRFQSLGAAFVFVLFLGIGAVLSINSWDRLIYFYSFSSDREPAAIKAVFDFSHLKGRALEMASSDPLMADARIKVNPKAVGVELGHFVTRAPSGRPDFACRIYDRVEMVFYSSQVMVSGEPAEMRVEGPCQMKSEDVNRMKAIWIPMANLMNGTARDFDLTLQEPQKLHIRFNNMPSNWPQAWHLDKVKIFNSSLPEQQVKVDRAELPSVKKDPVSFYWKKQRVPTSAE